MANNNVSFAGPAAGGIVTPAMQKATLASNYLNFHSGGVNWAQQYLPELYEQEVERYGNRTVASFLRMVGAEMPMASDQVIWSEQGRLHLAYNGSVNVTNGNITSITGIDSGATEAHAVRKGATVVGVVQGVVFKAFVTAGIEVATNALTIKPYGGTNLDNLSGISGTNQSIKFFVYGSEFGKGSASMTDAVEPNFKSFTNKPMIIKDHYEVSGSDTAQIGWIEVSGESGQSGYLWYLKAEGDTRVRYEDYLEMVSIEAEKAVGSVSAGVPDGSEGLLAAIGARGIVATNQFDSSTTAPDKLAEFDLLLKELDKQGAIEENMLFLNRDSNLYIDDLLAGLNPHVTGGVNY